MPLTAGWRSRRGSATGHYSWQKVDTQNTSLLSFITSCLLRQRLGASGGTQEEKLPPWGRRSCHCHCCGETRRFPHKGSKAALATSNFLSWGRKERRSTHVLSSLAFSRWRASRWSLWRALSADCYFPNPCTGQLVLPRDGESDGQDGNIIYPVPSTWGVTASSGITLQASVPEMCHSRWAFLPLWCARIAVLPKTTSKALVLLESERYPLREYLSKIFDC